MLSRSYLIFLLLFFATAGFANDANWDCQQDATTKAWNCVGSANGNQQKPSTVSNKPHSSQTVTPVANKPVEQPEPIRENKSVPVSAVTDNNPPVDEVQIPKAPLAENLDRELPAAQSHPQSQVVPQVAKSASTKPTPRAITEAPPAVAATEKPMPAITKPAVTTAVEQQGWNCDNKGKDGNWNCQLNGPDPKGDARIVDVEPQGFSLLDPAFDNQQEHIFNTLRDRLKTNPWGNCTMQLGTQKYVLADKRQREKADTDMNANYTEIYDNEVGNYQGNVDLKRADQRASANSANYDAVSETLDLHGNVFYSEDEMSLYTDTATLKLDNDVAKLRDTLFISPTTPIRGKASAVYRDSNTLSRYKDVSYTSCEPGNQDWVVHATDLKMNKNDGTGSAKNAWVEFKGVPVFYSPYLSFPTDDRRKSGFLAPVFGNTGRGGFSFSTPFYWNIAANFDATLRPKYYTKRGIMMAGDFRYLTEMTRGQVSVEYLPGDEEANKDRYSASIKNNTRFTENLRANLDLNLVSDKDYFVDLGNALSFPSFSHLRSSADASYIDQDFSLKGQLISYQTIDPRIQGRIKPYRRLPQVNFKFDHLFEAIPADTSLESEYVYFQHDDSEPGSPDFDRLKPDSRDNIRALASGHRFNIKPSVSFPLKTASAYVTPKLSLQYTQYILDNQPTGYSDSISRVVPIASVDSGLFLEKDINVFGEAYTHTIEPRLFYLYIPRINQEQIPVFDTSLYDFWFPALFRENRFNGLDRVQDANQISAALTTRLIDPKSGLEKLKLSVGQIFYFQDRAVTAPIVRIGGTFLESRRETSAFSPFVAELSSQFNKHLSAEAGLQWDPERNEIVRGKAVLHFENDPGELINIGYNYRKTTLIEDTLLSKSDTDLRRDYGYKSRDQYTDSQNLSIDNRFNALRNSQTILRSADIIQTDVSFRWPIYNDWFAIGRWQYSLLYNQTQDAFVGLEKENCCWRFRVIGRRFVNNLAGAANSIVDQDSPYSSQTGIYFQIELKGLTGFGEKLDDFFAQSIHGYRRTEF
jgi:LPS-assembly protein